MNENLAEVGNEREVVAFLIGDECFGIEVNDILEVNRELLWTSIPGAPPFVLGAANLRGDIVTVVDIRRILGYEEQPEGSAKPVIVVSSRNELVGIQVDQIADVLEIDPSRLEPPPENMPALQKNRISSVMKKDNGLIAILDLEATLS